MESLSLIELTLRGGVAGLLLLLGCLHARAGATAAHRFAALFEIGTAAYAIVSTPIVSEALGPLRIFFVVIATFNSVFFWWFATVLFDDDFRWQKWRWGPFIIIAAIVLWRYGMGRDAPRYDFYIQQTLVIAMMGHALWLALLHRKDDLIEPRRRFRLIFAVLVGLFGIVIAFVELNLQGPPPNWLTLLHAVVLAVLAFGFCLWLLRPLDIFAVANISAAPQPNPTNTADETNWTRLQQLMDNGIYRREGLTVATLANEAGMPEHQLRKLINTIKGFRNFSAFLNERRIEEAKQILADPKHGRRQILQIAMDLGYGSVGPFNRAFKAATNETPSAYRKRHLGN